MTRRERLQRCYSHQETDRPGVYSRTGFPKDDPSYDRLRAYLAAHTELKHTWSGSAFESADPVETSIEPYTEDFQRRRETLHTPKGDLHRSFLVSLKGQPGLHETFFVNTGEDAERYLSLPLPELAGDTTSFFDAVSAMGEAGIVDVFLGFNPGGFVAELCGSENFAIMSVTDRDVLHRLCERQMNIVIQRLKFLLGKKLGPYFALGGEEYIVPPLHGLEDFRAFNLRYDKPIIDLIHDAGGRIHVHSHGSIRKVFVGFMEMEVDVLHPFEGPPQGDILPGEAKAMSRGRMCLEGNIQIGSMYAESPKAIRRQTEQLVAEVFSDRRGLIVSPTASPYIRGEGEACFPQYKAMVDTVLEFGR